MVVAHLFKQNPLVLIYTDSFTQTEQTVKVRERSRHTPMH